MCSTGFDIKIPRGLPKEYTNVSRKKSRPCPRYQGIKDEQKNLHLSLVNSALEGSEYLHAPAALPPEKEPGYIVNTRLGRPHSRCGWFWRRENLLRLPGFEPRTVHLVANRFMLRVTVTINSPFPPPWYS
jgi:hypothetical protein